MQKAVFSIFNAEAFMAVRVKPVQATVIRSEKIIRQVIAEVRRKPSAKRLAELKEEDKIFRKMLKGIND